MARQKGPIQLTGSLGGLSFYKHRKYGMLARMCNPVSAERIAKDPAFARTRENGTEFGMVSRAGKLLRDGLNGFLRDVQTEDLDLRVMRLLLDIKAQDTVSARGQRSVDVALGLQPGLLQGFPFNGKCSLDRFVAQAPVVDQQAGTITFPGFAADHAPKKATHAVVTGFRGRIAFAPAADAFGAPGTFQVAVSEAVVLPLATPPDLPSQGRSGISLPDLVLTLPEPAGETGIEMWGLKIVFFQEINGERYVLKTGAADIILSQQVPRSEVDASRGAEVRLKLKTNRLPEGGKSQGVKQKNRVPREVNPLVVDPRFAAGPDPG